MPFEKPTQVFEKYEEEANALLPEITDRIKNALIGKRVTLMDYSRNKEETVTVRHADPESSNWMYIREDGLNHSFTTTFRSILLSTEGRKIMNEIVDGLSVHNEVKKILKEKITAR